MAKSILSKLFWLASLVLLTACLDASGMGQNSAFGSPLTTQEVRTQLAGSSLVGTTRSGDPISLYVDNSLTARYVGGGSERFQLLKNGILCNVEPRNRFCYRTYVADDNIKITYADGTVYFQGKITKGNIFAS